MEKACKTNITVKALAEDMEPDHDTIAAFISTNSEAVNDLFVQILLQCQELDLITGEMFAIDGCKLPSNACLPSVGELKEIDYIRRLRGLCYKRMIRKNRRFKEEKRKA